MHKLRIIFQYPDSILKVVFNAWKVSKHGVISDPNTVKYRPEITKSLDTFHAMIFTSLETYFTIFCITEYFYKEFRQRNFASESLLFPLFSRMQEKGYLTLSWRRPLSYRNQSTDLQTSVMKELNIHMKYIIIEAQNIYLRTFFNNKHYCYVWWN